MGRAVGRRGKVEEHDAQRPDFIPGVASTPGTQLRGSIIHPQAEFQGVRPKKRVFHRHAGARGRGGVVSSRSPRRPMRRPALAEGSLVRAPARRNSLESESRERSQITPGVTVALERPSQPFPACWEASAPPGLPPSYQAPSRFDEELRRHTGETSHGPCGNGSRQHPGHGRWPESFGRQPPVAGSGPGPVVLRRAAEVARGRPDRHANRTARSATCDALRPGALAWRPTFGGGLPVAGAALRGGRGGTVAQRGTRPTTRRMRPDEVRFAPPDSR